MRRIENSNLFVMPAGQAVINPLELLHLKEVRRLMDRLRNAFRWILLDSPPLLAASDANLLAALADGTLLVTRIGATTTDSMSRAIESLGQDSILGMVANGTPAVRHPRRASSSRSGQACAEPPAVAHPAHWFTPPKHQLK